MKKPSVTENGYIIIKFMYNFMLVHETEIALLKFKYAINNNLGCVNIEGTNLLETKGDDIALFGENNFRYIRHPGIKYDYSLTESYFNANVYEDYDSAKLAFELMEV